MSSSPRKNLFDSAVVFAAKDDLLLANVFPQMNALDGQFISTPLIP